MRHIIFLGRDQHVVELPGPIVERRNVGINVGVLADHHQTLFTKRVADMGQDHAQFGVTKADLVKEPGPGKFERRILVKGGAAVKENW